MTEESARIPIAFHNLEDSEESGFDDSDEDCSLEDSFDSSVARQHGEVAACPSAKAKIHFDIDAVINKGRIKFVPAPKASFDNFLCLHNSAKFHMMPLQKRT